MTPLLGTPWKLNLEQKNATLLNNSWKNNNKKKELIKKMILTIMVIKPLNLMVTPKTE